MHQRSSSSIESTSQSRTDVRVLFISTDTSLLLPTKQTLDGYIAIEQLFDEVHILVLRTGIPSLNPALRVGERSWLYTASSDTWWWRPVAGLKLVEEQLVFGEGFRPDLVVARDPFESGVLAQLLAEQYDCLWQVHVADDFTSTEYKKSDPHAFWHQLMAGYTLRRALSVRTTTTQLATMVKANYPGIVDLAVLPRLNNYAHLAATPRITDLKQQYPQYSFIYLFVGDLTYDSTLPQVFKAMRYIFQNKRVGLVVVGDGPARRELEEMSRKLQLSEHVVFRRPSDDTVNCLQSADAVVVTDTTATADEVVLQAAAVGTIVVATNTRLRLALFRHGESILLAAPESNTELQLHVHAVLNDVALRERLRAGMEVVLATSLHEDVDAYKQAYKQSIESALLTGLKKDAKLSPV